MEKNDLNAKQEYFKMLYKQKELFIRHNFKEAVRLECPLNNDTFKQVIRDEINIDTPPEIIPLLNKLAHILVAEYDAEIKATIISKIE